MGLIASGIFQACQQGRWVDVACDIDPCHHTLDDWLGQRPERGWPDGFEVEDDVWHPIADDALRPPHDRAAHRPDWQQGRLHMGQNVHSWLTADELRAGIDVVLADLKACLAERRGDDGDPERRARFMQYACDYRDEDDRLVALHGQVRLVYGLDY